MLPEYNRVGSSCPTDGHFSYTSFTSNCFSDDWLTLAEDHTPGDEAGNMLLVNAAPRNGTFLNTTINGLKSSTIYEFGVWMMNVCKPTDKCPFPLLPNITIRLQTASGKVVAQFGTGDLMRRDLPQWTQYRAVFTAPPASTALTLVMINNAPGGCGNDLALDDITFRECEKPTPVITTRPKAPVPVKQQPKTPVPVRQERKTTSPVVKKDTPVRRPLQSSRIVKPDSSRTVPVARQKPISFPAPPTVLVTRANPVIKRIETEAAEITLQLYDNGQIDGDTVSIYHNNKLVVSRAGLSVKPVLYRIIIDPEHPHHELIMVAENLGSIPPNTSLMILTAGTKRHEVFISSTEQKNAKIVIDLVK